jgi:hypothetical protein
VPETDLTGKAFPDFRPVAVEDRAFFEKKLAILDRRSCECSFANLLLWSEPYRIEWAEWQDRIVVLERMHGSIHFPIGAYAEPRALAGLIAAGLAAGILKNGDVYDTPEDYFDRYPDGVRFFAADADEDNFDYLYELEHLVEMSGPLLRKKRNLIKQFEHLYPDNRMTQITPENLPAAIRLAKELNARMAHTDFLDEEEVSLAATRRCFAELGMGGVLLEADGEAVGVSLYSKLNSDTYDIHFEKVDHRIKGAPQALVTRLAARLLAAGGRYVNREQDMGEPGLRQAKRSLDPCCLERRQLLRWKKES